MPAFKGFIACSLDGFIARPDGRLDWLTDGWPEVDHDHGYAEFMVGIDAIAMGRGTFDVVRSFAEWPYSKPCVVLSRTLQVEDLPQELQSKISIIADGPKAVNGHAAAHGWNGVYVDGGQVLSAFIAESLLDSLTITRLPTLIGAGKPLFAPGMTERKVTLSGQKAYGNGFVQSTYAFRQV
jgi:dihydrofolate reductase